MASCESHQFGMRKNPRTSPVGMWDRTAHMSFGLGMRKNPRTSPVGMWDRTAHMAFGFGKR